MEVGAILAIHCPDLESQIKSRYVGCRPLRSLWCRAISNSFLSQAVARERCSRYFYRNGKLVREGLIRVAERRVGMGDLNDCFVEVGRETGLSMAWSFVNHVVLTPMRMLVQVDRRMLDYLVGLDTELDEMVEGRLFVPPMLRCVTVRVADHLRVWHTGGSCYTPSVKLSQVVLADATKRLIVDTVQDYDRFNQIRRNVGFDEVVRVRGIRGWVWGVHVPTPQHHCAANSTQPTPCACRQQVSYGNGLILLFYGESGTGKTMTANALANHLNKRLLLVGPSASKAVERGRGTLVHVR